MNTFTQLVRRVTPKELEAISGVSDIKKIPGFNNGYFEFYEMEIENSDKVIIKVIYSGKGYSYHARIDYYYRRVIITGVYGLLSNPDMLVTIISGIKTGGFSSLKIYAYGNPQYINYSPLFAYVPVLGGQPSPKTMLKMIAFIKRNNLKYELSEIFELPQSIRRWEEDGENGVYNFNLKTLNVSDLKSKRNLINWSKKFR